MNTATAILPAAALCAALLLPVSGTADEAAPQTPPTPPGVRAEALDVRNGRSGNLLRGVLYRPEGAEGRLPVVLCAHEFGGDSRRPWWVRYATHLAGEGFAVYAFDFSGGGESSRSEGRTTEMSVMTEADDLESVLDAARGWDFADPARILLVGGSQGGAVSAVVAARRPDDIAALVLLYPAFVIRDDLHKKFASPEDVPDVYRYNGWIDIGPRYVRDMWDFDVYAGMGGFRRPVLLVHGDGDKIVPLAYSERALAAYPDARLVALKADTHVFPLPGIQTQCLAAIDAFLRETGFLPEPPPARAAEPLAIAEQGFFASGGTVTEARPGDYDPTKNWLDPTRAGNTAHIDHANTFYQIPAGASAPPVVFLHGYGQSRLGWMGTPDGRPGWSEFFLRAGHPVFLVDQPRRGAAGASARMPGAFPDAEGPDAKDYLPGDQAWYTHFRIGRVPPERYEGSQFPGGDEALDQFLRQGAPNTGDYDEALFGAVLGEVLADVRARTGRKAVYVTHSQGGRVGWATPPENVAAIVAVEPGFCPEPGDDRFRSLLAAKVPVAVLFGDGIDNGPGDIQSTAFWRAVRDQAKAFAAAYREAGGDAEVLDLPDLGIRGNSHFLFQERNSDALAALVENWLRDRGLATR